MPGGRGRVPTEPDNRTTGQLVKVLAKDADTETSNNALRGIFEKAPHAVAEDLLSTEAVDAAYRQIAAHVAQHSHRFYSDGKYSAQARLAELVATEATEWDEAKAAAPCDTVVCRAAAGPGRDGPRPFTL